MNRPASNCLLLAKLCRASENVRTSNLKSMCTTGMLAGELNTLGLQLYETFENFPLLFDMGYGFIAKGANHSIYVCFTGSYDWHLQPLFDFWDSKVPFQLEPDSTEIYGSVAAPFNRAAKLLVDHVILVLTKLVPSQKQNIHFVGYGLGSPILLLVYLHLVDFLQYRFRVAEPVLFACPSFVDSQFAETMKRYGACSLILSNDLLPYMPVTPQVLGAYYPPPFYWSHTTRYLDANYMVAAEMPENPAITNTLTPEAYVKALESNN